MALMRYIGTRSPVKVSVLGEDFGLVERGDRLAVPDELAEQVAWPETLWDAAATRKTEEASK